MVRKNKTMIRRALKYIFFLQFFRIQTCRRKFSDSTRIRTHFLFNIFVGINYKIEKHSLFYLLIRFSENLQYYNKSKFVCLKGVLLIHESQSNRLTSPRLQSIDEMISMARFVIPGLLLKSTIGRYWKRDRDKTEKNASDKVQSTRLSSFNVSEPFFSFIS